MDFEFPTPMPPSIFAQLDPQYPMKSWRTTFGPMVTAAIGTPQFIPVPFLRHASCFSLLSLFVEEPDIPLIGSFFGENRKVLRHVGNLTQSLLNQQCHMDFVEMKLEPRSSFCMEGRRGDITKGFHLVLQESTKVTLGDTTLVFNTDSIKEDDRNEVMYVVSETLRVQSMNLKMYHSNKEIWEIPACKSAECEVGQWSHYWPITFAVKLTQMWFHPITGLLEEEPNPVPYDAEHVTWTLPLKLQTGFDSIQERFRPTGIPYFDPSFDQPSSSPLKNM